MLNFCTHPCSYVGNLRRKEIVRTAASERTTAAALNPSAPLLPRSCKVCKFARCSRIDGNLVGTGTTLHNAQVSKYDFYSSLPLQDRRLLRRVIWP